MPEICNECQKMQREIEIELKEGGINKEDLSWRTCEKCGCLCPVRKIKFSKIN